MRLEHHLVGGYVRYISPHIIIIIIRCSCAVSGWLVVLPAACGLLVVAGGLLVVAGGLLVVPGGTLDSLIGGGHLVVVSLWVISFMICACCSIIPRIICFIMTIWSIKSYTPGEPTVDVVCIKQRESYYMYSMGISSSKVKYHYS